MFCRAKICTNPLRELANTFLGATELLSQQTRNTFILKRKWPVRLHRKGHRPQHLQSKNFVYELVENTMLKKRFIDVILTTNVSNYGLLGEKVSVTIFQAYSKLLLPGLAVYATPENIEKYKEIIRLQTTDGKEYSSKFVQQTIHSLSTLCLPVTMSKDNPWTLEPWHIKTSFRLVGFHVPEKAITLPIKAISGPDFDKENKEFYVTVTINSINMVNVRCRLLHLHLSNDLEKSDNLYLNNSVDPIFEEDRSVLSSLPKAKLSKTADN